MLIVTQNYTETYDLLIHEISLVNSQSNAVVDTGGKSFFICETKPDGITWYHVCAGDSIQSEQDTKRRIEKKTNPNISDLECIPSTVCVLGTYSSMRHAVSAMDDMLIAAGRGNQVFRMPKE